MTKPKHFDGPHAAHSMGGKASWAKLTPAQKTARARKMAAGRTAQRRAQLKKAA